MKANIQSAIQKTLEEIRQMGEGIRPTDIIFRSNTVMDGHGLLDEVIEIGIHSGQGIQPIAQLSYSMEGKIEGYDLLELLPRLEKKAEHYFKAMQDIKSLEVEISKGEAERRLAISEMRKLDNEGKKN